MSRQKEEISPEIAKDLGMKILAILRDGSLKKEEKFEIVKELIERGADVTVVDVHNETALHMAARIGDFRTSELLLLTQKIDASATNKHDITPLDIALSANNSDIAILLIKNNCDINKISGFDGSSPLCIATKLGNTYLAKLLVNNGAQVNSEDGMGPKPIIIATSRSNKELLKFFIRKGADPTASDHNGLTALHVAVMKGDLESVKILLSAGADLNAQDNNLFTPLHYACQYGHDHLIDLLSKNGSNLLLRTTEAKLPSDLILNPELKQKIKNLEGAYFKARPIMAKVLLGEDLDDEEELPILINLHSSNDREFLKDVFKSMSINEIRTAIATNNPIPANVLEFLETTPNIITKEDLDILISSHTSNFDNLITKESGDDVDFPDFDYEYEEEVFGEMPGPHPEMPGPHGEMAGGGAPYPDGAGAGEA